MQPHADSRLRLLAVVQLLGGKHVGIQLCCVPSRGTHPRLISEQDRKGNAAADRLAKQALLQL
eukprot:11298010-Prorocentrum_lima.AAC.1